MLMMGNQEKSIILKECKSKNLFNIRVYSVLFTSDDRYVVSGSDDTNIRFWKSSASDPIKLVNELFYFSFQKEKRNHGIIIRS